MVRESLLPGGGGGSLVPESRVSISRDMLKPVVLEWLSNDTRQYGFITRIPIIRDYIPAVDARCRLIERDDWTGALELLFMDKDHVLSNMRKELKRLPDGYTANPKYQQELEKSLGPKFVRFYDALWNLLNLVMDKTQIQAILSAFKSSRRLSYADTAYILAQYGPIAKYFTVPDDPQEQLELVKELGPQIYPNWQLKN